MSAKCGARGRPINLPRPALDASAAPSAMKGDACFIPTNTGSPRRSPIAAACAWVIDVRGEPPMAR
jgi:hypothetical protein